MYKVEDVHSVPSAGIDQVYRAGEGVGARECLEKCRKFPDFEGCLAESRPGRNFDANRKSICFVWHRYFSREARGAVAREIDLDRFWNFLKSGTKVVGH